MERRYIYKKSKCVVYIIQHSEYWKIQGDCIMMTDNLI